MAELHRYAPRSPTLLLSDYRDARVDTAALAAGLAGVVHKSSLADELQAAVDAVLAGRQFRPAPGPH